MIHVTAGTVPDGLSAAACEQAFIANVKAVAPLAADAGVTLMLEPLCHVAVPGYLHSTSAQTLKLIEAVGAANVKLQYDFFHMQIMQGDHVETLAPVAGFQDGISGILQLLDDPLAHINLVFNTQDSCHAFVILLLAAAQTDSRDRRCQPHRQIC